ncbi:MULTISPECIES: RNA polymerase sporulation sigma factor SigH [unclassified Veillonella]|jgi:RNA polymerase sigma factor, sigma-70 family|uniref:RNA polymerase sporulation sigma factor SigH n=1 Tax=unclassified Veillonella TaxID=2630086 RepID=UPI00078198AA|nr:MULTISPECIES: RNA polymerase sporulation sigma factor SigH [unclassified Veillonella]KXB87250.1 RNA polymerase sigma-H factor [Veillonella sp. DNF00869]MBS6626428.1 RNA polymerase sporulation sigma factor SigH [Veillonella sp. oral taxon 780]
MSYETETVAEFERFSSLSDEEIVDIYQRENNHFATDYIVQRYKNFVRSKARSYFLMGADKEDIIQEGMIGLYKATRDYNRDREVSFKSFAELCITRQIISAIKGASRQKHIPLNSYISLNKPAYDDSERTLIEVLETEKNLDPEEVVINREQYALIKEVMEAVLSPLEWDVLRGYMDAKSYQEMAEEHHRSIKSIDNALQRVKKKMEVYFGHNR